MLIRKFISIAALGALSCALIGCDPEKVSADPNGEGEEALSSMAVVLDELDASGDPIKMAPDDGDEVAVMQTSVGRMVLMFHPEVAPNHVANFKKLSSEGFYDGTRFNRVVPKFMIQGGDPKSKYMQLSRDWGTGDNVVDGRRIQVSAEFSEVTHERGVLSMARGRDDDSASCQFFIVHQNSPHLDGTYSAFGRVVEGLEVIDEIVMSPRKDPNAGSVFPSKAIVIEKITIETWPLE